MRARHIVGKTIASVKQQPLTANTGDRVYHMGRITFTDGSHLILSVAELETEYAVIGTFYDIAGRRIDA